MKRFLVSHETKFDIGMKALSKRKHWLVPGSCIIDTCFGCSSQCQIITCYVRSEVQASYSCIFGPHSFPERQYLILPVDEYSTYGYRDKMATIVQTTFSSSFLFLKLLEYWLIFYWNGSQGSNSGLILGLRPANERHRCKVTPSLIGWCKPRISHSTMASNAENVFIWWRHHESDMKEGSPWQPVLSKIYCLIIVSYSFM